MRVAQVTLQSPSGGLPTLTVRFAGRDVTPPHILVSSPGTVEPNTAVDLQRARLERRRVRHRSDDRALGVLRQERDRSRTTSNGKLNPSYSWKKPGAHKVIFSVKDRAGNVSMYRFTTLVLDTVRPAVTFSFRPPMPGAHRLRVVVKASESVHIRLLVTQGGRRKPLLRRVVTFWGEARHSRSIPLNGGVGRGVVLISGIARDLAGNATALPQCVVDPVSGQGSCTTP